MSLSLWWVACKAPSPAVPVELGTLTEGEVVSGFRVDALYVDSEDKPVGVSLHHLHSGLDLRLLTWDSVPQSFLWVNTVPSSDRGEPHTQEHLLLGKGNRGRAVATLEEMSMAESSAYTEQHRTVYHFRTTAGPEVFFDLFDARLEALLSPDYLDEEIRREVHHWGIAETAEGLALEEKGTVYNEMDSSMQQPAWVLWGRVPKDLYGPGHPQAFVSGGTPDALRELTPEHIRTFHAATYQLANMGVITFLPPEIPLQTALRRFDAGLLRLQPEPTPSGRAFPTEADLPPPRPVADRSVRELRYPSRDKAGDASLLVALPPGRELPLEQKLLLDLLFSGLAGAENSNLYRALIDSRTRERDIHATSVSAWVSDDPGWPVYLYVGGLSATELDAEDTAWIVARLRQELTTLAALPPGDPALLDLRRRLQSELVSWRRAMRDSMTGTPGFGTRGTGSDWHDHLVSLDRAGGFRRALLLDPQLAWVEAELARDDNPWAEHLARWELLSSEPFVYVNRPDPAALEALQTAKEARIAAELDRLRTETGAADEASALLAFDQAYDRRTTDLEASIRAPDARFLESPPLVPDPELDWEKRDVAGVPWVVSRFDRLGGAKIGLALDLRGTTAPQWLRILPRLLTDVGVVVDGVPISNQDVLERLQREVLTAAASTDTNADTHRAELVMYAAGTDPVETRAALGWVRTFLESPDWRPENLPRIRDVVDESFDATRRRMQGSEEGWGSNPPAAWRQQDDAIQLHLWSFLTYEHDLLRLRYRLMDPDPAASAALEQLATAAPDRTTLGARLTAIQKDAGQPEALVAAAGDLERVLGALPDESLAADWSWLCRRLAADLAEPPTDALRELDEVRRGLLRRGGARLYSAGGAMLDTLAEDLAPLVAGLEDRPAPPIAASPASPLRARVSGRGARGDAIHVGLLEPNRRSGIVSLTAPLTGFRDLDSDAILDFLALRALGGGGAHSLFIRTWGAGLAYSNGSSASELTGRMAWSADRCPTVRQTTEFVIGVVESTPIDPAIAEYAVASAFWSRADGSPESRSSGIARQLADGETHEQIRAFREALLAERQRPDLVEQLQTRMPAVYGRLLPGIGMPTADIDGMISFVIGDAAQLSGWAAWVAETEGPEATFEVLHPRDFWLVP